MARSRDPLTGRFSKLAVKEASKVSVLEAEREQLVGSLGLLEERLAELELALEDEGWMRVGYDAEMEFSPSGLIKLIRLSRLSWLKNPLIRHAVEVTCGYVFGQGVKISGRGKVGEVVDEFLTDKSNLAVLTSHQAMLERERQLEQEGNVFFVFFVNESTGYTRLSYIPTDEILAGDIIRNPSDRNEIWYYKRIWTRRTWSSERNTFEDDYACAYYPDWRYTPEDRPEEIGGDPVYWDQPVYHVKQGGLTGWRFGAPEYYSAIDWAKAVKEDLEDYASLRKALSRFAWLLTTKGGREGVKAARKRLNTTLGAGGEGSEGSSSDRNPAPSVGSTFIASDMYGMSPIKTAGAAPSPEEGRRLWYMVSAGTGIPEPILAGDATQGTYATAKTLDRPTELKMRNRQALWHDVLQDILDYVVDWAVRAPSGLLPGTIVRDERRGGERIEIGVDPDADLESTSETGELLEPQPMDRAVDVDFPDILERDVVERVTAIILAATLDGKTPAGTIDPKTLVRLLLQALGEQDSVDQVLDLLFGANIEDLELTPTAPTTSSDASEQAAYREAFREFKEALLSVAGGNGRRQSG